MEGSSPAGAGSPSTFEEHIVSFEYDATARMRVGTRVETRPESEEDPPPRAEPTFESLCANVSQWGFLESREEEMVLQLTPLGAR